MEGKKMPDRIDERKRIYLYYTCLSQSLQSSCSIENPFLPNSNGRNHGWLEIERELRDRKWAFSVHVIYPSVTVFSSALIFFLYHLQTQKSCFSVDSLSIQTRSTGSINQKDENSVRSIRMSNFESIFLFSTRIEVYLERALPHWGLFWKIYRLNRLIDVLLNASKLIYDMEMSRIRLCIDKDEISCEEKMCVSSQMWHHVVYCRTVGIKNENVRHVSFG